MQKPKVSIVIVHYHVKKILFDCIKSIYDSRPKTSFEIIVVDNDEVKSIESRLKEKYPKVNYIASPGDLGYGKGNNLGIKDASGEYVFILNPDTVVRKGTIDKLVDFIHKNKKVGIVAPTLEDGEGNVYPLQGTSELTPLRGIFGLSFLNKLFPKNKFSRQYWLADIDRSKPFEVDVVPGSAFLIKKSLFEGIGAFDKNFFLYFEEADLCKRVKEAGYKLFILPSARIIHFWAVSTPKSEELSRVFAQSRFYYFKKNFGILNAFFVEFFARLNKSTFLLLLILSLGTFLRFYRLIPNAILNGEMGTDYMNVWDIIHGTRTWLVGPTTSHQWFSIPPISYWIYTAVLYFFKHNPISVNIFWAVVGSFAVWVSYYYLKKTFNENVALISSFLLAVSPGFIFYTRASRYNAPIAILFFPYLYYLKKSIENRGKSLGILGFILGFSMSFFPSPFLFIPAIIVAFIFYRIRPKLKDIFYGVLGFVIPNITYFIYDAINHFQITKEITLWIPFRILGFFGLYPKNTADQFVISQNLNSIFRFFAEVFSPNNYFFALTIFSLILIGVLVYSLRALKNKDKELAFILIITNLLVSYIGLFVHGDPPEHYYLVIFPIPLILASYILVKTFKSKILLTLGALSIGVIGIVNLINMNWFYQDGPMVNYTLSQPPYSTQSAVINEIIKDSAGKPFSIARIGSFDKFENNFSNNYIFLLTVRGAKITEDSALTYTIVEDRTEGKAPKGVEIWGSAGVQIFKYIK